jgi:alpha-N-arabinofuranosidase
VLTAASFATVNTFDAPNAVQPRPFSAIAVDGKLVLRLAPHSVTVVRLEP